MLQSIIFFITKSLCLIFCVFTGIVRRNVIRLFLIGGDKKGAVTIIAALSSTCGVVLIGLLVFRYRRRSVPSPSGKH